MLVAAWPCALLVTVSTSWGATTPPSTRRHDGTPHLDRIEALDQRIVESEAALQRTTARRDAARVQLADIERAVARTQAQAKGARQLFVRRLRALARLPPTLLPKLGLGAESLTQALADRRLLAAVAAHDRHLHQQYEGQRQQLAELEAERTVQQASLDGAVTEGCVQHDELLAARRQRDTTLAQLREHRADTAALGAEAATARRALGEMLHPKPGTDPSAQNMYRPASPGTDSPSMQVPRPASALRPPPAPQTAPGQRSTPQRRNLRWPATGQVRVYFGERIDLAYGTLTAHNGWDIGAPPGAEVQAVATGQVAYAGWLRGYGQVVIVDHGDALYAVVAHLATVQVGPGEAVEAGDTLGTVGDTGSLRGPILYFELRHRGTPVDPGDWLARPPTDRQG